jgi:hypothetical protein
LWRAYFGAQHAITVCRTSAQRLAHAILVLFAKRRTIASM